MSDRYRYYLTEGDSPEREVGKAEFVSAERRAGFVNTMGQPDEPATAGFSGRAGDAEISGRMVYVPPEQMTRLVKCFKPDCVRKVTPGVAYCCEPCQVAGNAAAPYEVEPYEPGAYWLRVHSEFCEDRKTERGECDPVEAAALNQSRAY